MMFLHLDKGEKDHWLPVLFDLLYENMSVIAPSGMSYEDEKAQWLSQVSPALDKAPRQIVLGFAEEELVGYMQYYLRQQMLMVEEIQLKREYQKTSLFYGFCKYLASVVPEDLQTVEAYADKRNLNSICLMERLGMTACETDTQFVHMRGRVEQMGFLFRK